MVHRVLSFLHLIWSVMRVDYAWYCQLLLSLVLGSLLNLRLSHIQIEICGITATELLREGERESVKLRSISEAQKTKQ